MTLGEIQISAVQRNMNGTFTCIANNAGGNREGSMVLIVNGKTFYEVSFWLVGGCSSSPMYYLAFGTLSFLTGHLEVAGAGKEVIITDLHAQEELEGSIS